MAIPRRNWRFRWLAEIGGSVECEGPDAVMRNLHALLVKGDFVRGEYAAWDKLVTDDLRQKLLLLCRCGRPSSTPPWHKHVRRVTRCASAAPSLSARCVPAQYASPEDRKAQQESGGGTGAKPGGKQLSRGGLGATPAVVVATRTAAKMAAFESFAVLTAQLLREVDQSMETRGALSQLEGVANFLEADAPIGVGGPKASPGLCRATMCAGFSVAGAHRELGLSPPPLSRYTAREVKAAFHATALRCDASTHPP